MPSTLGKNIAASMKKRMAQDEEALRGPNAAPAVEEFDYEQTVPPVEEDPSKTRFGRLKRLLGYGPKVAMK